MRKTLIDFMFFGATEASEKSFRLLRGYPLVAAAAAALRANWLLPVAVLAFAAAGILVLRHPLHARVGELDAAANAQAAGDTRYREADGPGEFFGDHGTVSDVTRRIRAEDRARHHEARFQSLFGDPAMLRQVWVNLIFNAFKFSAQVAAPRIAIGCRVADGEIDFSVVDNGAGFDPGYTGKLCGIFQRLHSRSEFEGTGVGLAIVKRIIERHHGRVWAEGAVGQGASVHFTLPETSGLVAAAVAAPQEPIAVAAAAAAGGVLRSRVAAISLKLPD